MRAAKRAVRQLAPPCLTWMFCTCTTHVVLLPCSIVPWWHQVSERRQSRRRKKKPPGPWSSRSCGRRCPSCVRSMVPRKHPSACLRNGISTSCTRRAPRLCATAARVHRSRSVYCTSGRSRSLFGLPFNGRLRLARPCCAHASRKPLSAQRSASLLSSCPPGAAECSQQCGRR